MARMGAELKGNIHLRHDELKKNHVRALKRSRKGSHKVVGDVCTVEIVRWLEIAESLMQVWSFLLK